MGPRKGEREGPQLGALGREETRGAPLHVGEGQGRFGMTGEQPCMVYYIHHVAITRLYWGAKDRQAQPVWAYMWARLRPKTRQDRGGSGETRPTILCVGMILKTRRAGLRSLACRGKTNREFCPL
jgi:hypothetical protein